MPRSKHTARKSKKRHSTDDDTGGSERQHSRNEGSSSTRREEESRHRRHDDDEAAVAASKKGTPSSSEQHARSDRHQDQDRRQQPSSSNNANNSVALATPATTSTATVLSLEEQIRIQESLLQTLIDRQSQICGFLRSAKTKHSTLQKTHQNLQKRRTQLTKNQIKHFTLQKEIHDSLLKSRERLGRLESLEQEEQEALRTGDDRGRGDNHEDNDDGDLKSQPMNSFEEEKEQQHGNKDLHPRPSVSDNDVGGDTAAATASDGEENQRLPETQPENNSGKDPEVSTIIEEASPPTTKQLRLDQILPPNHSITAFAVDFNRNHRRSPTTLWTFLPLLGPEQMKSIMTMFGRDTNVYSDLRRQLLWNTCLDFSLLSKRISMGNKEREGKETSTRKKKKDSGKDDETMDPNVSMCPYELSGVCADDFCPYQHTTKERIMVPREQLPLPPLKLLRDSVDGTRAIIERKKDVNDGKLTTRPTKKAKIVLDEEPSIPAAAEEADDEQEPEEQKEEIAMDASDMETEEEFMELPAPAAEDELAEEQEDEGDDRSDKGVGSEKDKSVRWSFWWGGVLEGDEASIEDTLSKWVDSLRGDEIPPSIVWLGRLIDVCRITIHMGRINVTSYVLTEVLARIVRDPNTNNEERSLMVPIAKQLSNLHKTHLIDGSGDSSSDSRSDSSFYRTSFVLQTCLAVLSETVQALYETGDEGDIELILESTHHCINALMTNQGDGPNSAVGPDVKEVVNLIISNYSGDKQSSSESSKSMSAVRRFQDLENGVRWAETAFQPQSPFLASLHGIEDQVLKPCWSFCTDWIQSSGHEEQVCRDRVFKGLLASAVIGFAILGSLERFAANIPLGDDKLNANMTAALMEVDSTINRLLNRLLDELSDLPLFNLLLAPLSAASVSTASFLRIYSNAQHRLEGALQLNEKKAFRGPTSALMGSLSELLWSQLLQLRMTLPTDDNSSSSRGYDWEISQSVKTTNSLLLERMRICGVRTNHITLPGDSLLCQAMSNDKPEERKAKHKAKKIEPVATNVLKISYEEDDDDQKNSIYNAWNVNMESREDDHGRIPSAPISTLPRSILLIGKSIKALNLVHCSLSTLPLSFGLYFPNLLSLNLSKNLLRELPRSFKELGKLQELLLDKNQIETLGVVAGRDLRKLVVRNNKVTSVLMPITKCVQLEELNLSGNFLEIPEVELALWTVRLKKLRRFDYHPQQSKSNSQPEERIKQEAKTSK